MKRNLKRIGKSMTKEKERRDREKKEKAKRKREKKGREKRKIFGVNLESQDQDIFFAASRPY
jgi:hypothetical protein